MEKKDDEVLTGEVYENVYIAEAASSCEKDTGYRSKYRKSEEKIYPFREGHEYIKNPNYVQGVRTAMDELRNAVNYVQTSMGENCYYPQQGYCSTSMMNQNSITEELLRAQQQCCCTMDRVREYQQYQMNQTISGCPGYTP